MRVEVFTQVRDQYLRSFGTAIFEWGLVNRFFCEFCRCYDVTNAVTSSRFLYWRRCALQATRKNLGNVEYRRLTQYLARRSQIPIASPEVQIKPSSESEPHIGHSPEKWSLGLGLLQQRHDIFDRYAEFGYRFSFHELEDNQEGHFFSQMKLMDLKLRYYSNGAPRLRLHQVSLIDIFSLYPINTYEQKGTWQFEFSFKDFLEPECYHCYGTRLKAAYGYSFEPFQEHKPTLYSLLGARIDTFEYKPKTLRVSPGLGLQFGLWSTIFTSSDSLQGEFSRYYLPTSKNYDRPSFVSTSSIRYSFDFIFSRLHLSYERKDLLNEFEIRFSRYL